MGIMRAKSSSKVTVTSAEFQKRFGLYREVAQRAPVAVTSHGRESVVLISATEYARLKEQDRQAQYVWEMDEEALEELAKAEPAPEAAEVDRELKP